MIKYIIGLIIYLILDISWIYLNKNIYIKNIENIQKSKIKFNPVIIFLTYIIISLYLIFLIYYKIPIIKCVIISFFIYSIYNLTNLSTFNDYSVYIVLIDTFWGSFVTFITMYIVQNYKKILNF
jgi:uncharacterized membrane protein